MKSIKFVPATFDQRLRDMRVPALRQRNRSGSSPFSAETARSRAWLNVVTNRSVPSNLIEVIDGDTVRFNGAVYRMVDTPERGDKARCDNERPALKAANWAMPRSDFGCRLIPLYLGLFMQNSVQQRIMNLYLSIVADESKFAEFVHEVAHAGSGRSNHLCQCFLADVQ